MKLIQSMRRHVLACLAIGFAALCYWPSTPPQTTSVIQASSRTSQSAVGHVAIERLQVGQRVVTYASDRAVNSSRVDSRTWKKLALEAIDVWSDGTRDDYHIETMQPPEWLATHNIRLGGSAPIPFDLEEMGGTQGLKATVVKIEACPAIPDGPGRVVISTINHLNKNCCDLVLQSGSGGTERIIATDIHPFWSATRQEWIAAIDLSEGELVSGLHGQTHWVQSVTRTAGTHRVYNMTVETDHVYRVGLLNVLVHNNYPRRDPTPGDMDFPSSEEARDEAIRQHGGQLDIFEEIPVYGRNPNLTGPNGEPYSVLHTLDNNGELIEIKHHSNGHEYHDNQTSEWPHYHGPNDEHLNYPPKG